MNTAPEALPGLLLRSGGGSRVGGSSPFTPSGGAELLRGSEEKFWPKRTGAEGAREDFGLAKGPDKNVAQSLPGGGPKGGGGAPAAELLKGALPPQSSRPHSRPMPLPPTRTCTRTHTQTTGSEGSDWSTNVSETRRLRRKARKGVQSRRGDHQRGCITAPADSPWPCEAVPPAPEMYLETCAEPWLLGVAEGVHGSWSQVHGWVFNSRGRGGDAALRLDLPPPQKRQN